MDRRPQQRSPEEVEMLAPGGTWGITVVVICTGILAFLIIVPIRAGASQDMHEEAAWTEKGLTPMKGVKYSFGWVGLV